MFDLNFRRLSLLLWKFELLSKLPMHVKINLKSERKSPFGTISFSVWNGTNYVEQKLHTYAWLGWMNIHIF